ncbi:MAG: PEP-CTERM sorting domain-containing protein [Verrucomicrobiota bacterium]|nr:PEP-CTERM sorting domain-containing protein [Verrucomicrobiota bacterium]
MKKLLIGATSIWLLVSSSAFAVDGTWNIDAAGNWSLASNWLNSIIADGAGSTANFTFNITANRTVTIDTASRTLGVVNIGDADNTHNYTIAGGSLIFDNTPNSAHAQLNALSTSHGDTISAPVTLNSILDITNSSASILLLSGVVTGTNGMNINAGTGIVRFTGNNAATYSGGTNINAGSVTMGTSGNGLGTNTVNLGATGGSSVSLTTTAALTVPNAIVVAALGGGNTATLGSSSAAGSGGTNYSGTITLNGTAQLTSASTGTGTVTFSNAISGAGGLVKVGTGPVTLSGTGNSFAGGTLINVGTLIVTKDGGLGTGNVSLTASGVTLTLQSGATNDYINDNASISIVNGATANLNYASASTDIVNGIILNGVAQTVQGTYGSSTSGAMFQSAFFSGTGTLTLIPEPATYMLIGLGALVCAQQFRRKKA